jgi:hypothetical protein
MISSHEDDPAGAKQHRSKKLHPLLSLLRHKGSQLAAHRPPGSYTVQRKCVGAHAQRLPQFKRHQSETHGTPATELLPHAQHSKFERLRTEKHLRAGAIHELIIIFLVLDRQLARSLFSF